MITIHGPILLDLNTQRDLLTADGVYPVGGVASQVEHLRKVFTWAQRQRIPVVSTRLRDLLAPAPGRGPGTLPIGRVSQKLVCDPATPGYQKIPATQLRKRQEMPMDCGTDLPVDGFKTTQQFIFDLPSLNPFECPRLDRLLSETEAAVWVLVGGPLEWTVRTAVLGLLQRRHKVAVVSDAIGHWDAYEGDMALRQIESKNIEWLTAQRLSERFGKPVPVRQVAVNGNGAAPKYRTLRNGSASAGAVKRPAAPTRAGKRAAPRGKLASRPYRMG